MRLAAICVCIFAVVTWLETTDASPMENYFQKFKGTAMEMMGGDSNPGVKMFQTFLNSTQFDAFQKQFHDQFSEMSEGMQKEAQKWMAQMQKMAADGASENEMKEKFSQMMEKFGKSTPSKK